MDSKNYGNYKTSINNSNMYVRHGDLNSALAHGLDSLKYLRRARNESRDANETEKLDRELAELSGKLAPLYRSVGENERFTTTDILTPPAQAPHETRSKINPGEIDIHFKNGKIGGSLEGDIFKCDYRNAKCAIKIYKTIPGMEYSVVKSLIKKDMLNTLSLNHPNVLRYYGYYTSGERYVSMPETIGLVMDLAQIDLNDALRKGLLEEEDKKNSIMDILAGLNYLHSVGVVHSDLKPGNVLLIPGIGIKYRAQLCDFGLSAVKKSRKQTIATMINVVGYTINYAAPEMLKTLKACAKSDLFALASTAYYLVTGKVPYQGLTDLVIKARIEQCIMPELPELDDFWRTLFRRCWVVDPKARPDSQALYSELLEVRRKMSGVF